MAPVKRVCIIGPESTGKSTLAENLARHFGTVHVPEYAQQAIAGLKDEFGPEHIETFAKGQIESEDALAQKAEGVLVCDSDLLTTMMWSELLFNDCPDWIRDAADSRSYDLYLLTDIDVPWVADIHRVAEDTRPGFLQRCKTELESRGRDYVMISGNWDQRFDAAVAAIENLLNGN